MNPLSAILLLGPTGSGKTPLGECLEKQGLWGRRCHHFDFGANLRRAAEPGNPTQLPDADRAVIRRVLQANALLEDHHSPIALRLLHSFAAERDLQPADLLVLNGLPRHTGQASALQSSVHVHTVLLLDCSAEVVRERIRLNSGGDRTGRDDDSTGEIARKLETYQARTLPLVRFYETLGADIRRFPVQADSATAALHEQLERQDQPSAVHGSTVRERKERRASPPNSHE